MTNFIKENWYKLMVGSSLLMTSFALMIYSISPAYSINNANQVKSQYIENNALNPTANGVIVGDNIYFVDDGYVYQWDKSYSWNSISSRAWLRHKLPE